MRYEPDCTVLAAHGGVATPWNGMTIPRRKNGCQYWKKIAMAKPVDMEKIRQDCGDKIDAIPSALTLDMIEKNKQALAALVRFQCAMQSELEAMKKS